MQRYPIEEIRPGDVFIGNDAYTGGGTHLPDIVLAEPIFVDGAHRRLGGQPRAPRRLRRSRPRPHLPGRPAHPAGAALPRRRAAAGRAGPDPAELPGAARAPVRPARADGGQPPRRAALPGAVRRSTAPRPCWRRARRCWTTPSARRAPASPPSRRHLALRGRLRQRGDRRRAAASGRDRRSKGDEMSLALRRPPQVRAGINMV